MNNKSALHALAVPLLALLASGCHRQPPAAPAAENDAPPIMRGCDQTERLLKQMAAAEKSFTYDAAGNATLKSGLWNTMSPELQDGLVKAVAYHAICQAGEVREQSVTIRSEDKKVLAEKKVAEFQQAAAAQGGTGAEGDAATEEAAETAKALGFDN